MKQYILFSVCFFILPFNAFSQQENVESLKNFHKVDEFVFRSEQPQSDDFSAIEARGIKTVINLRNRFNDKREVRKTNLKLIHVPINSWKINYLHLVTVLKIINQSEKPVLVHCLHGADRTGCVVACYRIIFNGWSKDDAIKEFLSPQFGYHDGWFPKMKNLLEEIDEQQLKEDVLN